MASTVASDAPRTLANPLRPDLAAVRTHSAKADLDANRLAPSEVLALLRQAASETGTSQKVMAINAGISESVLSEALHGRRHFAAEWWWSQDDYFVARFLELVTTHRGLTAASTMAAKRARIAELVNLLLEVAA